MNLKAKIICKLLFSGLLLFSFKNYAQTAEEVKKIVGSNNLQISKENQLKQQPPTKNKRNFWIEQVKIGVFAIYSGDNGNNYSDFTSVFPNFFPPFELSISTDNYMTIALGLNKSNFFGILTNVSHKAWIDYNRNNIFEESEVIFRNTSIFGKEKNFKITVPKGTKTGLTKMRVSVKGLSLFDAFFGRSQGPLGFILNGFDGEFEDYNVLIGDDSSITASPEEKIKDSLVNNTNAIEEEKVVEISPNPTKGILTLSEIDQIEKVSIYDFSGNLVLQSIVPTAKELDVSTLKSGIYFLNIQSKNGSKNSMKFIKE